MALLHHWKFSNNLQDAVGDVHFTNVIGTPLYTANKDGLTDKACDPSNTNWYATTSDTISGFDEDQRSYSFWFKKNGALPANYIYFDKMYQISISTAIFLSIKVNSTGYSVFFNTSDLSLIDGIWYNVIMIIDRYGTKKIFVDGILKRISTAIKVPFSANYPTAININRKFPTAYSQTPIDEFKYFDHILSDGGVVDLNQPASSDSEVWQLYLSGVNNIPAYTLNPATDITGTSAKLTWNES